MRLMAPRLDVGMENILQSIATETLIATNSYTTSLVILHVTLYYKRTYTHTHICAYRDKFVPNSYIEYTVYMKYDNLLIA